jgi:hypothetical protein
MDVEKPNCIGCHHIHPDNGNCTAVGGFCTAVPAAHCPLIPELRAELEQVKRERDAAQVTLAETSGLAGGVVQTLFGVPLERMRELAKAELEGRIVLRSAGAGKKCGSCGNFHRIPGTKRGTCAIRQWERNRLGQTEHWRHSFTPSQSYGACRDYIPREDDNHG